MSLEKKIKINPCPNCAGTNIQLRDCGYSSFNPGWGECKTCKHKIEFGYVGCLATKQELAQCWNDKTNIKKIKIELKKEISSKQKELKRLEKIELKIKKRNDKR